MISGPQFIPAQGGFALGSPRGFAQPSFNAGSQPVLVRTIPNSPPSGSRILRPSSPLHQTHPSIVSAIAPQQVPYRGIPQAHSELLNASVANRKGPSHFGVVHPPQDPFHPKPSYIQEHIQRRPYTNMELFQDMESIDLIRTQATRIDNLMDRAEILEREISKMEGIEFEKEKDLHFWESQYKQLETHKNDSLNQINEHTVPELDYESSHIFKSKREYDDIHNLKFREIEEVIDQRLREIEELNEEIAYYKSISIPKEFEADSLEIRRLHVEQKRLLESNAELNRQLITFGNAGYQEE